MRMGIPGGQEPQRRVQGQVSAERDIPARPRELQVGIEAGQYRAAALDQAGPQLRGAPQAVSGPESLRGP